MGLPTHRQYRSEGHCLVPPRISIDQIAFRPMRLRLLTLMWLAGMAVYIPTLAGDDASAIRMAGLLIGPLLIAGAALGAVLLWPGREARLEPFGLVLALMAVGLALVNVGATRDLPTAFRVVLSVAGGTVLCATSPPALNWLRARRQVE